MTDHYSQLGISRNANESQIKKAYKKLALRHHPDKNQQLDSGETFKRIVDSYAVLSDPVKKSEYDNSLEPKLTGQSRYTSGTSQYSSRRGTADNFFNSFAGGSRRRPNDQYDFYQGFNDAFTRTSFDRRFYSNMDDLDFEYLRNRTTFGNPNVNSYNPSFKSYQSRTSRYQGSHGTEKKEPAKKEPERKESVKKEPKKEPVKKEPEAGTSNSPLPKPEIKSTKDDWGTSTGYAYVFKEKTKLATPNKYGKRSDNIKVTSPNVPDTFSSSQGSGANFGAAKLKETEEEDDRPGRKKDPIIIEDSATEEVESPLRKDYFQKADNIFGQGSLNFGYKKEAVKEPDTENQFDYSKLDEIVKESADTLRRRPYNKYKRRTVVDKKLDRRGTSTEPGKFPRPEIVSLGEEDDTFEDLNDVEELDDYDEKFKLQGRPYIDLAASDSDDNVMGVDPDLESDNEGKFNMNGMENIPPFTQDRETNFDFDNMLNSLDPKSGAGHGTKRAKTERHFEYPQGNYESIHLPVNTGVFAASKRLATEDMAVGGLDYKPPLFPADFVDVSHEGWVAYKNGVEKYQRNWLTYGEKIARYQSARVQAMADFHDDILGYYQNSNVYLGCLEHDMEIQKTWMESVVENKRIMSQYYNNLKLQKVYSTL